MIFLTAKHAKEWIPKLVPVYYVPSKREACMFQPCQLQIAPNLLPLAHHGRYSLPVLPTLRM